MFKNPILDAAVLFPLSGVRPDLQLSVVVSLLDALYVPLRKRVAAAQFEEAKLRVTGAVLDFAAQVRTAFYVHQANEQLLELRQHDRPGAHRLAGGEPAAARGGQHLGPRSGAGPRADGSVEGGAEIRRESPRARAASN